MSSLPEHSVGKRYLSKLTANAIGMPLLAFIQACSARVLGPAALGDFSFVTSIYTQIISFFDAGSSEGLYTKLAQRPKERALLKVYGIFAGLLLLGAATLTMLLLYTGAAELILPGQPSRIVWLGLVFAYLMWLCQLTQRIVDCFGLTIAGEIQRIGVRLVSALTIGSILWIYDTISLELYFLYQFFILGLMLFLWSRMLKAFDIGLLASHRLSRTDYYNYGREFLSFSAPLLVYSAVGLTTSYFDRFTLQQVSGSEHQGYFALGNQIAAFCFVFSAAMTPLFIREFSRAFAAQDKKTMRGLFDTLLPRLFTVTALLGVFVSFHAESMTRLFGGEQYRGGVSAVMLLGLYPLHQTFGQLSGSVFYVSGQTRLYRNIGVAAMLLGVPLTLFLVGPKTHWGMELGATGLAMKTVLLQLLVVGSQLWFNCKLLESRFLHHIWLQLASTCALFGCVWSANCLVSLVSSESLTHLILSGVVYLLFSFGAFCLKPTWFGFVPGEWKGYIVLARASIRP